MNLITGTAFLIALVVYAEAAATSCPPPIPSGSYWVTQACSSTIGPKDGAYCTQNNSQGVAGTLSYRCHCSSGCGFQCDPDPNHTFCPAPPPPCAAQPVCTTTCVNNDPTKCTIVTCVCPSTG